MKKNILLSAPIITGLLAVSACAPDDVEEAEFEEVGPTQEATEESNDPSDTEDVEDDNSTEEASDENEEQPTSDSDVENVFNALTDEFGDDIIIEELEDEGSYYEAEFFVPSEDVEYEAHIDLNDYSVYGVENEGTPDSDDRAKYETVNIDFLEAVSIAEAEVGSDFDEADLERENGVVVWEIELKNDMEVYVSVEDGSIIKVDD